MKIIGSYVSPYVRKVLACLELKGLDYEVDPITPFFGNDEFERLSPLRRIPVLVDGDLVLTDSSVICAYLDEAYPGHAAAAGGPEGPRPRPLAGGICRHAAGRRLHLGPVLPEVVHPRVWGEPGDRTRVERMPCRRHPGGARLSRRRAARGRLPVRRHRPCRHRHRQLLPQRRLCRFRGRCRPLAEGRALRRRTLAHPVFEKLLPFEQVQLGATIKGRRQALLDAGAQLTAETCGSANRARGIMRL